MSESFKCGDELRAAYPFVRTTYEAPPDGPEDSPVERPTWRPGVEHEAVAPYGDTYTFAEGMGEVVFTVIGVFKPGSFPKRVFYTRQWVDPEGKRFGNGKLRITTEQNFRVLVKGYRHEYELADQQPTKEPA